MKKIFYISIISSILLSSCRYSFTGASISPNVKSISISQFPNNALLIQPALSRTLTEVIRDKFTNQTSLRLVNSNGDLIIEGEITAYTTEPVAVTSNQQAAMQRLKIIINVRFTNKQDSKQDFEASFSRYRDYDSRKQLSAVETDLIQLISEELAQDIFNKSVVNW